MEPSPSPTGRQGGRSRRRFRLAPVCGFCRQTNIRRRSLDSYYTLALDGNLSIDELAAAVSVRHSIAGKGRSRGSGSWTAGGTQASDSASNDSQDNDGNWESRSGAADLVTVEPGTANGAGERNPVTFASIDCRPRKSSGTGSESRDDDGHDSHVNTTEQCRMEDQEESGIPGFTGIVARRSQCSSDTSEEHDRHQQQPEEDQRQQQQLQKHQSHAQQQQQHYEKQGWQRREGNSSDPMQSDSGSSNPLCANDSLHLGSSASRSQTSDSLGAAQYPKFPCSRTSFEDLSFNVPQWSAPYCSAPFQNNAPDGRTHSMASSLGRTTTSSFHRTNLALREATQAVEYAATILEASKPGTPTFDGKNAMPMLPLPLTNEIISTCDSGFCGESTPSNSSPATQISAASREQVTSTDQEFQFVQAPLAWTAPTNSPSIPKRRMLGYFSLIPRTARQPASENAPARAPSEEASLSGTPLSTDSSIIAPSQSIPVHGVFPSSVVETPEKSSRRDGSGNLNRFSVMRRWRPWLGENRQKDEISQQEAKRTSDSQLSNISLRSPRGTQHETGYGQYAEASGVHSPPVAPMQDPATSSVQHNQEVLITQVQKDSTVVGQYPLHQWGRHGQVVPAGRFPMMVPLNDGPDLNPGPFLGSPRAEHKGKHTLILDLDETLVHSSFVEVAHYDFIIPVEIEGVMHSIYVAKRPGVDKFLEAVAKKYEVVIFTASLAKYADPLMDNLDPHGYCVWRLFREKCTIWNNQYVKDLSKMGRELKKIIILDNSPNSYAFQPENAIPIESWFEDTSDTELFQLIPILDALAKVDDIPAAIRSSIMHGRATEE